MISVIIPTMWKPPHLSLMLPILNDHPLIGEIIIIDNDRSKTDHELLKKINKLVYWSFAEGNIFVNPAWNWGAKVAKYDKLFILNDDCMINLQELDKIYDAITPEIGMLGFSKLSYCTYTLDSYETLANSGFGLDLEIKIIDPREYPQTSGMPHAFYGSAYFIHKSNYIPIPEEFKIYYGDLFLYVSFLKRNIHNYIIENGLVMTYTSTTVSTIAKELIQKESSILKEKFAELGLKDIKYTIPDLTKT
jgi:hypothetical protein